MFHYRSGAVVYFATVGISYLVLALADPELQFRGPHGERGARVYNGGLGRSPQRGPGVEPLVRGSGGRSP